MSTLLESVRGAEVQRSGQGGRFYVWKKESFFSVTTIIGGGVPKPVLVNWAKKFVAQYAIDHHKQLYAMVEGAEDGADRQGVLDWLKESPYRDRDKKAELGSIIHDIAEAHVIQRPFPLPNRVQAPYVSTFFRFLNEFKPRFIAVEMPVFNRTYKYAGTLDAIMEIPFEFLPADTPYAVEVWGEAPDDRDFWRILVDYKTGASGPWPEVGLQNTAYRNAEFTGLPNGREAPMPSVDGCAVLKIRPEGYEFYPVRSDVKGDGLKSPVMDTYLYAREIYRWAQELSKNVIGGQIISEAQLSLALEASLEAVGEANGGENPALGNVTASETSEEPSEPASSNGGADEGAGGQAKAASSPEIAEEPAPAPSPKPRKPRAKKEAQ